MKLTRSYLQRLIKEETNKLLREEDTLPVRSQININQIRREVGRPEFLDAANLLAGGRGDTEFAQRLKVALVGHSEGHAAAMSDLSGILDELTASGVIKGDPGNGVSPEEQAQAILSVLSPGDTGVHTDSTTLKYSAGQLQQDKGRGTHDFSATASAAEERGALQETRVGISESLRRRRGIHPVAQRKRRNRSR